MLSIALLAPSLVVLAGVPQEELSLLRSEVVTPPADRARALQAASGRVGWIRAARAGGPAAPEEAALRVEPTTGAPFEIPPFRDVRASADGRTVVAWGDPAAPEHPFVLHLRVYRDGRLALELDEGFSMGSSLTVADDGRFGIVGYHANDRSQWEAVWSPTGREPVRRPLPAGLQARDPVLMGDALLVRVHALRAEGGGDGSGSAILRVTEDGVSTLLEAPGALELIGLPETARALVRTASSLALVDATSGGVLWTRAGLRPIGPHAWADWTAEGVIAVLAGDVQRAGAPPPPARLFLLDAGSGAVTHALEVERRTPLPEARLHGAEKELVLEWRNVREAFGFARQR